MKPNLLKKICKKIESPTAVFIGILFIIPLAIILFIPLCLIESGQFVANKLLIKKNLKEILYEGKKFHNIDMVDKGCVYFKNNITNKAMTISSSLNQNKANIILFKESIGSLDTVEYQQYRLHYNILKDIKNKYDCIFVQTLCDDHFFLKNVHNYDLADIDSNEFKSILSLDISDTQKALLLLKYPDKLKQRR